MNVPSLVTTVTPGFQPSVEWLSSWHPKLPLSNILDTIHRVEGKNTEEGLRSSRDMDRRTRSLDGEQNAQTKGTVLLSLVSLGSYHDLTNVEQKHPQTQQQRDLSRRFNGHRWRSGGTPL